MTKHQRAPLNCVVCQRLFDSEPNLLNHMYAAHPGWTDTNAGEVTKNTVEEGSAPSFLTQKRSEMDAASELTPRETKEEYAQPDNEKEAGGEG